MLWVTRQVFTFENGINLLRKEHSGTIEPQMGQNMEQFFLKYIMNGKARSPFLILERDRRCVEDYLRDVTVNYPRILSGVSFT